MNYRQQSHIDVCLYILQNAVRLYDKSNVLIRMLWLTPLSN